MGKLCRFLVLCVLLGFSISHAHGQFVDNAFFHALNPSSPLNTCTTANVIAGSSSNPIQAMSAAWFSPTKAYADFFYGCDNLPLGTPDFGVPTHSWYTGTCEDASFLSAFNPPEYLAYAGLQIHDNTAPSYREYISQRLRTPLQQGRTYYVSFMVRPSDLNGQNMIQRLGVLMTAGDPSTPTTTALSTTAGVYAEAEEPSGWGSGVNVPPSSNGWYLVEMPAVFAADTSRYYMTIGNFQSDIPANEWFGNTPNEQAYYMVDNVYVCDYCPQGVSVKRASGSNAEECCFDITLLGNSDLYCNTITRFTIDIDGTTYSFSGAFNLNDPITVCLDRFSSGVGIIKLYDANNTHRCTFAADFECSCQCNSTTSPAGFNLSLQRKAGSGNCCWDIVVNNLPYTGEGCDVTALGIKFSAPPPAIFSPAGGYTIQTLPGGTTYLTQNNTNGGDIYYSGTSTVIGTVCLPQNTLDVPVSLALIGSTNAQGEAEYCGLTVNNTLSCADACCDEVLNSVALPTPSPDSLHCCFRLETMFAQPLQCITNYTLQYKSGAWINAASGPIVGPVLTLTECVPLGSSKHVRILFKNAMGKVVCMKEFTLKCEDDCCAAIKNLHAYRVSSSPCCYRVRGEVTGSAPGCSSILSFAVQEYNTGTTSWNLISGGSTTPYGTFEALVCPTSSNLIRIVFYDGMGNEVCTRWLRFDCFGLTNPKLGTNSLYESLAPQATVAPNPTVNEATIHYMLRQSTEVRIAVFDGTGSIVAEIQPAQLSAGQHTATLSTSTWPAGIYFVQINAGNDIITAPITVIK